MNNEIKNIRLKFPCPEDLSAMKVTDNGKRLCDKCKHKLIDFRNMNKADFENVVRSQPHTCGIFNPSQLNQDLLRYAASALIAAAAVTSTSCETTKQKENEACDMDVRQEIARPPLVGIMVPPPIDSTVPLPVIEPIIELEPAGMAVTASVTLGTPILPEEPLDHDSIP